MTKITGTLAWATLSHVPMRAEPSDVSECVNEVLAGDRVLVLEEGPRDWVRIRLADGYEGWVDRRSFKHEIQPVVGELVILSDMCSAWHGVPGGWLPAGARVQKTSTGWKCGEADIVPLGKDPQPWRQSMASWAMTMVGVPYHWGGRSGWGWDCSGLVQTAASLVGKSLPRDASQQFLIGQDIPRAEAREDDLAFFSNSLGKVTHVGICLDASRIVHASGWVRMDGLTDQGIVRTEDGMETHRLCGVRRIS